MVDRTASNVDVPFLQLHAHTRDADSPALADRIRHATMTTRAAGDSSDMEQAIEDFMIEAMKQDFLQKALFPDPDEPDASPSIDPNGSW